MPPPAPPPDRDVAERDDRTDEVRDEGLLLLARSRRAVVSALRLISDPDCVRRLLGKWVTVDKCVALQWVGKYVLVRVLVWLLGD